MVADFTPGGTKGSEDLGDDDVQEPLVDAGDNADEAKLEPDAKKVLRTPKMETFVLAMRPKHE